MNLRTVKAMPITRTTTTIQDPTRKDYYIRQASDEITRKPEEKKKITWLVLSHLPKKSKMHQLIKNNEICNRPPSDNYTNGRHRVKSHL